jgi:hypothetical protein
MSFHNPFLLFDSFNSSIQKKKKINKMSQLSADCLNEIFEYLEEDVATLSSCLLVNRLWCEVSVRILWRRIRSFKLLFSCTCREIEETLYENGLTSSISTSKPPTFNYISFCKVLSVDFIYEMIDTITEFFEDQGSISKQDFNKALTREIFKLLMNQISSLKSLKVLYPPKIQNFTSLPGARDCLKNLTELQCNSNISDLFYGLSQICHHIQLLDITYINSTSNGLTDLISAQQNLKDLKLSCSYKGRILLKGIDTSLEKLPNHDTLIKLYLDSDNYMPIPFITKFTNLQEIMLSFDHFNHDFKELSQAYFPHLRVLKFQYEQPSNELLIKILENNGKNLQELYFELDHNCFYPIDLLALVETCPNLKKLYSGLSSNKLETLKMIFNGLQHLESIKIRCEDNLNEKNLLEVVVKHSPKNFYELKLNYSFGQTELLLPEELEFFFTSWAKRIPQKSLSLIIINDDDEFLFTRDDYMKIINKYMGLGIIKQFKTNDNLNDFKENVY